MKILYFECFSGISGDMGVGALLDLGVPKEYLLENLGSLGINDEFNIEIKKMNKNGIIGTDFNVILNEHICHGNQDNLLDDHPFGNDCSNSGHDHDTIHDQKNNQHNYDGNQNDGYNHYEHDHDKHQNDGNNHDEHDHEGHQNDVHNHDEHFHDGNHHGRNLKDIEELIDNSGLNDNIKNISKSIFKVVAKAEAKVHGKPIDEVHFHEVGAVDSIVDIVSISICIDYLKPDMIITSPVNTGKGFVKCMHGVIPVPAPATLEILKGVPTYCDDREMELTTPTGAAVVKALSSKFGSLPVVKVKSIGYGCGKRESEIPNLLRVILCEDDTMNKRDDICILEATIDDMNPQLYGYLMDKLLEAGVLDVYYTPVYMKKNRPGIIVTITTYESNVDKACRIMFKESTTIGIRKFSVERFELNREIKKLNTSYGDVRCKVSSFEDEVVNTSLEYEDMKRIALERDIPLKKLYKNIGSMIRE